MPRRQLWFLLVVALAALTAFFCAPVETAPEHHFGFVADPVNDEAFLQTLAKPEFAQAAPNLIHAGDEQDVFLWRSLLKAYKQFTGKDWITGAQGTGDCVSWAYAHAVNVHLAILWELGEASEWREAATEPIYGGARVEALGARFGGYGQGASGGGGARWLKNFGVIFRQEYSELGHDLRVYSSKRAIDWGNYGCGGKGDAGRLDAEAKKHPVLDVALVTTYEEAVAAIKNGYPVVVCSNVGFTSQRDKQGFLVQGWKPWAHAMCFTGIRYGDRPGLCCQNSWGPSWVSGPKYPADQPEGSFWVDKATVSKMLAGRSSYAVSGMVGFPRHDLSHGDWVDVAPRRRFLEQPDFDFAIAP